MVAKSFVLGRPGSGKTTAYNHISNSLKRWGWTVRRIRDYDILRKLYYNDLKQNGTRFRPIAYGGFDVVNFTVLDEALVQLEQSVREDMLMAQEKELIMIEFARKDYQTAMQPFTPDFVRDTHILFIDAEMETCIERIKQRVQRGKPDDNHYVSEHILREYYGYDNRVYMTEQARLNAAAREEQQSVDKIIHFIDNNGPLPNFHHEIDYFVKAVIEHEQRILVAR